MRSKSDSASAPHTAVCDRVLENRRVTAHQFFLGYAYDLFRHAKAYTVWKNLLTYFRKFRMVAFIIQIISAVSTILQTGALVLLSTAIFLVVLPLLTAFMLGILLTALLESRKSNKRMKKLLDGRQIYILFLSKQENPFFAGLAQSLAQKENSAVIVLSPYWISGKGLHSKQFFCTVRRESQNLYLIRRYYFFKLKKHVLGNNVTYLY